MSTAVKESRSDKVFLWCNYIYLTIALVIVLYPLLYIISASISDPKFVSSGEMWLLPKGITFEGYARVFENTNIWIGYKNTIIYTVLGTLVNLMVTLPAAYALSRSDFAGRGFFMAMFMVTMFFSGGLVPSYLLVKDLGMVNSIWALILPGAASIWNIIVCRTFFQSTIPKELQEAAHIDGCTNTRLFIRIVLPLSMPIIAVMALFYGVGHWNSYFSAMIYLNDSSKYPLQLFLRQILVLQEMAAQGGGAIDTSSATAMNSKAEIAALVKYAVIIVSTLPVIAIYPFLQRYFVQGVMIGSVKG
ncbi:carbohydrate ABC transporter permease [Paenibacillus taichungensis]|jgi:putative aldouronate transport system permease protein|uniref:Carbohydrate ABC transporter permease n=1 Tax=Paenibacillus taichungensis TaxID=484184 RepID=A0ABX2MVP0_9BACL|nr:MULTISPECIES: carbohydrate ABC transporter permease [Paenibacillus]OME80276.1 sugar ABC transporter permease [Paenibacillus pabuli]MDR9744035.1 carbohydrate ABC transporter permease [Paenibacillus taichungensis]MEC0106552.1 carbohydrate ABC transporter permease [Paenibacillus taichungensis]MEC0198476.1 carbohydrate ABC transporter permease [Paenibacillus taichungensis]NEU61281.1 carbohydrate ABC transporter permease [Paenibacillus sp. ALJ109b]